MTCFFVGGSQRSGTTMLQTLLCQDPSVNPLIQEAKYLRHLVMAYKFGKATYKVETQDYFRSQKDFVAFNSNIVRNFIRNTRKLFPDTQHLVLREPHLTMMFTHLAELLPRAKFICVVRDPRDVVASMIKVGEKLKKQGAEDAMAKLFNSRDTRAISQHYLSFYAPVLQSKSRDFRQRLLYVKYEDLVTQPEQEVQKLREFTGIRLDDDVVNQDPDTGKVNYRKLDDYKMAWATNEYSKKITDSRIGGHTKVLSEREARSVVANCVHFMQKFNYTALDS